MTPVFQSLVSGAKNRGLSLADLALHSAHRFGSSNRLSSVRIGRFVETTLLCGRQSSGGPAQRAICPPADIDRKPTNAAPTELEPLCGRRGSYQQVAPDGASRFVGITVGRMRNTHKAQALVPALAWFLSRLLPAPRCLAFLILAALTLVIGCKQNPDAAAGTGSGASGARKLTIALLPKSKGNAYFVSCKKGAERAARDLGVDLLFDGPTNPDPARQNEIVDNWITLGVDAIAAACENKDGISTALRKARAKGIKVITYDADSQPDAREFFVNQATPQGIGYLLMDEAARLCQTQGEYHGHRRLAHFRQPE